MFSKQSLQAIAAGVGDFLGRRIGDLWSRNSKAIAIASNRSFVTLVRNRSRERSKSNQRKKQFSSVVISETKCFPSTSVTIY